MRVYQFRHFGRALGWTPKRKRGLYSDTMGLSTLQWSEFPSIREPHFSVKTQTTQRRPRP